MLICRNKIPSPLLVKNFIKQFTSSTSLTFHAPKFHTKPLSATRITNSSSFDALSSRQKEQISLYVDSLLEWNQKMNLTAVKEVSEVMERHVEDSLAIIPPLRNSYASHCNASCENISIVDVGSGAGLPGLILAIACPGWEVTLLESLNKRCVFLEHVVGLIGAPNVHIIRGRAEEFGQKRGYREEFDVAVARAVAEMRVLAEYCIPLVRVGGLFVAAKGHDPAEEVKNAERAIQLMGASVLQLSPVESRSPFGQRTAVICLKDRPTPAKYPRDPALNASRLSAVSSSLIHKLVVIFFSRPCFCQAPWGGNKRSGFGRELGEWGLENYLSVKQVTQYISDEPWGWYRSPEN